MSSIQTPNMGLISPTVGNEPGPDWANEQNGNNDVLDGHDHSPGKGVAIQPGGLNINSDLPFQANNLTGVRAVRFKAQTATLAGASDIGEIYVVNNELYYNDVTGGNNVQLTNNGVVNSGAGSISGLPSGTASASYAAGTFTWQSATATAANMDAGSYVLRNSTASSKGLTLQPPNAMAADYALSLPSLPAAQKFMTLDASGNMGAPWAVDGTTIEVSSNTIQVKALGITTAQIAANTIVGTNLVNNVDLPGQSVAAGGQIVMVSNYNGGVNLATLRGQVNANGSTGAGEGYGSTKTGTGQYTITFTNAFSDAAVVVATPLFTAGVPTTCQITSSPSATGFTIETYNAAFGFRDANFTFIAIGKRA